jgi:hypothetical protein
MPAPTQATCAAAWWRRRWTGPAGRRGRAALRGRPLDRVPLAGGGPGRGAARRQAHAGRPQASDPGQGRSGAAPSRGGRQPPEPGGAPGSAGGRGGGRAGPPLDAGPGPQAPRPHAQKRRACGRRSRTGPRSRGRATTGGRRPPASPLSASCSSTRAPRSPAWSAPTPGAGAASARPARPRAAAGSGSPSSDTPGLGGLATQLGSYPAPGGRDRAQRGVEADLLDCWGSLASPPPPGGKSTPT